MMLRYSKRADSKVTTTEALKPKAKPKRKPAPKKTVEVKAGE